MVFVFVEQIVMENVKKVCPKFFLEKRLMGVDCLGPFEERRRASLDETIQ